MTKRLVRRTPQTEPAPDDLTVIEVAEQWLTDLALAGKAERTVATYRRAVEAYAKHSGGRLPDRAAARSWMASRADRAGATRRLEFAALHAFGAWLAKEGVCPSNPLAGLPFPRVDVQPVQPYEQGEIGRLLDTCKGWSFTKSRDRLIIRLLSSTGVRRAELCGIKLTDIDHDMRSVTVVGKGARKRLVHYDQATATAIVNYDMYRRRHKHASSEYLLLTERGPMSGNAVGEVLRRRAKDAGLDGVHPHKFRHSFATRWLLDGGSESSLMDLAGWSSGQMLRRYTAHQRAEITAQEYRRLRG